MKTIKKYSLIIISISVIILLVLFRAFSYNRFKGDPAVNADATLKRAMVVTSWQAGSLGGNIFLLTIDEGDTILEKNSIEHLTIREDELLLKENIRLIKKTELPVVINCNDKVISARVWMILNQMGCRNLFIINDGNEEEAFQHKFRPDTAIRPEL